MKNHFEFYYFLISVIIKILMGTESSLIASKHYEELLLRFSETVKTIFQTTTKLYDLPVNLYQRLNLNAWKEFKESVDSSLFLGEYYFQIGPSYNFQSQTINMKTVLIFSSENSARNVE